MTTPLTFWRFITPASVDLCWEWVGQSSATAKYPRYGYKGKTWIAHRMAYTLAKGPIPSGKIVRHTCDNPRCCNPAHLEIGTHQDNHDDMVKRGRRISKGLPGEKHHKSKLTEGDVQNIRSLYSAGGESTNTLARKFNVSQGLVSQIVLRRIWRHIP